MILAGQLEQLIDRQSVGIVETARPVGDSDYFHADMGQFFYHHRADIAETLDDGGAPAQIRFQMLGGFDNRVDNTPSRGVPPTQRTANSHRFSGDYFWDGMTFVL